MPPATPASIYIKPGTDSSDKAALHYHRDLDFRRAEIKGKGTYAAGKMYFVRYKFNLSNYHEHLAIFQWHGYTLTVSAGSDVSLWGQMLTSVSTQDEWRQRRQQQPGHSIQPAMNRNTPHPPLTRLHAPRHRRQIQLHLDRLFRLLSQYNARHSPSLGHELRRQQQIAIVAGWEERAEQERVESLDWRCISKVWDL